MIHVHADQERNIRCAVADNMHVQYIYIKLKVGDISD